MTPYNTNIFYLKSLLSFLYKFGAVSVVLLNFEY